MLNKIKEWLFGPYKEEVKTVEAAPQLAPVVQEQPKKQNNKQRHYPKKQPAKTAQEVKKPKQPKRNTWQTKPKNKQ